MRRRMWPGILLAAVCAALGGEAVRQEGDPFLGDWQGQWAKEIEGRPRAVVAQVIPRGGGSYQINILPAFDGRGKALAVVQAQAAGERLRFDDQGWSGEVHGDRFTGEGGEGQVAFEMKKVVRLSPRLGAKPPEGAVVLFDGTSFDPWEPARGDPKAKIRWQLEDGVMRAWPTVEKHTFGTSIRARRAFASFQLHVEFRLPLLADVRGQNRANSGIIIEDYAFQEVQILDSYGLEGRKDECGALYNLAAPDVHMCAPPLQWQSYDITFRGPRYDAEGKLVRPGRITVNHNGRVVHKDRELRRPRGDRIPDRLRGKRTVGRITLQHHGDPVEFRNIWLVELDDGQP